jgi:UDP-2-acetamido-3-amino-2,3-dideoxy-glucuronate N-acetyltransferase
MRKNSFIHKTTIVDDNSIIGAGTKIWHFCHISSGAVVGKNCNIGQNVFIGEGVEIGNNVKVQNNVSIYSGVTVEDDVFLGPSCVFTNVVNPRAQISRHNLYESTIIKKGATIGANSTLVCGITVGRYSFVAAGAVVVTNVRDYSLVVGVPARHTGWMSRHGQKLKFNIKRIATCSESGYKYYINNGYVVCMDLGEDEPLPKNMMVGKQKYRN